MLRVDYAGKVGKVQTLGDGSVRIPARIARTGIQTYHYGDGTSVKEYRPPEVVFSKDSMEGWPGLAVTVGHPSTPVNPNNWNGLAKGHVQGEPKQDGQFLALDIIVKDAATIERIQAGELVEVSAGYWVDVEAEPGTTPDGERYDTIQRRVVGNHVALGPKGWGRAGPDVRLFAGDAADATRVGVHYPSDITPEGQVTMPVEPTTQTRNDQAPTTVEKAVHDVVLAERDALALKVKNLEAAQAAPKTEPLPGQDSKLTERVTLRVAAVRADSTKDKTITKLALDSSKSDLDVMLAVIQAQDPDFKADGKSVDYVRCRFDMATKDASTAPAADPLAKQAETDKIKALAAGTGTRADADDGNTIERSRAEMVNKNRGLWKQDEKGTN